MKEYAIALVRGLRFEQPLFSEEDHPWISSDQTTEIEFVDEDVLLPVRVRLFGESHSCSFAYLPELLHSLGELHTSTGGHRVWKARQ